MRLAFFSICLLLMSALFVCSGVAQPEATEPEAGPIILVGIIPETGGPDGTGPIATWVDLVESALAETDNGKTSMLVLGGGKTANDDVTQFWREVARQADVPAATVADKVRFVNGGEPIRRTALDPFALVVVVGADKDGEDTGGLTPEESAALAERAEDFKAFVTGGGAVIGFGQRGMPRPYEYLRELGTYNPYSIHNGNGPQYVDVTAEGEARGIFDPDLDVCCWDDFYFYVPSFMEELIHYEGGFDIIGPVAVGGRYVCPSVSPETDDSDGDMLSDAIEGDIGTDPCDADTDSDGLRDSWECESPVESPHVCGFDLNFDGELDDFTGDNEATVADRDAIFGPYYNDPRVDNKVNQSNRRVEGRYSYVSAPNPLHKDVFLELDWIDCDIGSCPGEVEIVIELDLLDPVPDWAPIVPDFPDEVDEIPGIPDTEIPIYKYTFRFDNTHHAPDVDALYAVANFLSARSPAVNPDPSRPYGVDVHFLVDDRLSHTPNCDNFDDGEIVGRNEYFGTSFQQDYDIPYARGLVYRYIFSGHSTAGDSDPGCELPSNIALGLQGAGWASLPAYDFSPFGAAPIRGKDILVSLGPLWICDIGSCNRQTFEGIPILPGLFPGGVEGQDGTVYAPMSDLVGPSYGPPYGGREGIRQIWSRSLMHLLGHSFGLEYDILIGNEPTGNGDPVEPYPGWGILDWNDLQLAPGSGTSVSDTENYPTNLWDLDYLLSSLVIPDDIYVADFSSGSAHIHSDGYSHDHGGLSTDPLNVLFQVEPDLDSDGITDGEDNCINVSNEGQENIDFDSKGDECDEDIDGDFYPNWMDDFPLDTDDDETNNDSDTDDDNDGDLDVSDNCSIHPNDDQANLDSDDFGNRCDADDDDDEVGDFTEYLLGSDPLDDASLPEFLGAVSCSDSEDNDLDSLTDGADSGCVDTDSDAVPDSTDECVSVPNTTSLDRDRDGQGDDCDTDADGDGEDDGTDLCLKTKIAATVDSDGCSDEDVDEDGDDVCNPEAPSDGPGDCTGADNCIVAENALQTDTDGDVLGDECDNCPEDNNNQRDLDSDGDGDICDDDLDGDGDTNDVDNCVEIPDDTQDDTDSDDVGTVCDNCPEDSNGSQTNSDEDSHGDDCDACPLESDDQLDSDEDDVGDACDICIDVSNSGQADDDDDLLGNACDNCPNDPNPVQADTDEDGDGDACDASPYGPCEIVSVTIWGTIGPDELTGTSGDDVIVGLGGGDIIEGLGGNDILCGGPGYDEIEGGEGSDVLFAGGDGGPLVGGGGADDLIGGSGSDELHGNAGDDDLIGLGGSDFLVGGDDDDDIDGGDDVDSVDYSSASGPITASLDAELATGEGTDSLVNIEEIVGSPNVDDLTGDEGDNSMFGGEGDDVISGGGGADYIEGGAGEDELYGDSGEDYIVGLDDDDTLDGGDDADILLPGAGDDAIDGGAGLDIVSYSDSPTAPVSASLQSDTATGAGSDTFTSIEGLIGTAGDDELSGDSGENTLEGSDGHDLIVGGDSDDIIDGGNGYDTCDGEAGTDQVTTCEPVTIDSIEIDGAPETAVIDSAGEALRYSFEGTADQDLSLDLSASTLAASCEDPAAVDWSISGEDGTVLLSQACVEEDDYPFEIPTSQTYWINLGDSEETGEVVLTLIDLSSP